MIDLQDKETIGRLYQAIKTSRDALVPFCLTRTDMIRTAVGSWYPPKGARYRTYVNLLNQTQRVFQMALASNNPQVKVNSFNQKLWPFCRKYEVNINKCLANMDFCTTLQECVMDAFFLIGMTVVRMADAGFVKTEQNVWVDPGKPWVDRVSPDDAVLDMSAKNLRSMRFVGNRYRVSWRKFLKRDDFDQKIVAQCAPQSKFITDASPDVASEIDTYYTVDDDELEPMIWLQDVYIPENREWVTMATEKELPPLKTLKWKGSDQGPYKFLHFGWVPDNIMPSSPASNLLELHNLINRLYLKLSNQANRQKNVVAVAIGAEDDGQKAKDSRDGEWPLFRDVSMLKPIQFPGPDGNTNAFAMAAMEIFNNVAGNVRAIGGLGSEAETATQEGMIQNHAQGMIGFMKQAVVAFSSDNAREIGCMMWDDKALKIDSSIEVENTGYRVDASWKPGQREGLKDHYEFSVEPNSTTWAPPEAKLQKLTGFLQVYLQMLPVMQAGGVDSMEFARIYAEYANLPEILRIVKQMQLPQGGEGGGDPHQATKAPVTERNVTRTSQNRGPQGQGAAAVLAQAMQSNSRPQPMMAGAGK
jgi:hypothetical protein